MRGDHWGVIGAGDGDVDLLGDHAAVLVVEGDGEALDLGLAGGEILDCGIGDGVGPGDLSAGAAARRGAALFPYTTLFRSADRGAGGRDQVDVGEVDIAE